MAVIENKVQKIFAASGPTGIVGVFGSYKGGATAYSDNIDLIQGYTGATGYSGATGQCAWTEGWNAAVDSNLAPTIQDMNAFFHVVTKQIAYSKQCSVPDWLATKTYYISSYVKNSAGYIFESLDDGNINNALTDDAHWKIVYSNKKRRITDDDATLLYDDYIVELYSTNITKNLYLQIPDAASKYLGRKIHVMFNHNQIGGDHDCFIYQSPSNVTLYQSDGPHLMSIVCTGTAWKIYNSNYLSAFIP